MDSSDFYLLYLHMLYSRVEVMCMLLYAWNAANRAYIVVFQNQSMVCRLDPPSLTTVFGFEQLCDISSGFCVSLCVDIPRDADMYYDSRKLFGVSPSKLPLRE